jgi:hypothetical protein
VELLFQAPCLYLATTEVNVAMEIMGFRKKEVMVVAGIFLLFVINACGVLYMRYFNRPLLESLPAYPHYLALRAMFLRPFNLIGSFVAICALFLAYRNTRRKNAAEEFQLIMLAFALAMPLGLILIILW